MAKKIVLVSPPVTLVYPHIEKPDTFGKQADNKYKTNAQPRNDQERDEFMAKLKDAAEELLPAKAKVAYPLKKMKDGKEVFVFKSKFKPAIKDAKKHDILDPSFTVGSGTVAKIAGQVYTYEATTDQAKAGFTHGIGVRLGAVQVLDHHEGGGGYDDCFTEEDEGFDYASSEDGAGDAEASDAYSL